MKKPFSFAAIALFALTFSLAACGDDDDTPDVPQTEEQARAMIIGQQWQITEFIEAMGASRLKWEATLKDMYAGDYFMITEDGRIIDIWQEFQLDEGSGELRPAGWVGTTFATDVTVTFDEEDPTRGTITLTSPDGEGKTRLLEFSNLTRNSGEILGVGKLTRNPKPVKYQYITIK